MRSFCRFLPGHGQTSAKAARQSEATERPTKRQGVQGEGAAGVTAAISVGIWMESEEMNASHAERGFINVPGAALAPPRPAPRPLLIPCREW